jgi:hypothetical protein
MIPPARYGEVVAVAAAAFTTLFGATLYYRNRWLRARDALVELRNRQSSAGGSDESLMHAVDAIAVEVERVSESQRFIARLMAAEADKRSNASADKPNRQLRASTPVP